MNTDAGQDSLWQVYLLQCADQSLYVGVTTDLARRLLQHNGQEHALRRLSREQKLALISGAKERG